MVFHSEHVQFSFAPCGCYITLLPHSAFQSVKIYYFGSYHSDAFKITKRILLKWLYRVFHLYRFHVFRAFKTSTAPNNNMAEVGHSRNATRGAKNDTLARVAEYHIVESAILKAKFER